MEELETSMVKFEALSKEKEGFIQEISTIEEQVLFLVLMRAFMVSVFTFMANGINFVSRSRTWETI